MLAVTRSISRSQAGSQAVTVAGRSRRSWRRALTAALVRRPRARAAKRASRWGVRSWAGKLLVAGAAVLRAGPGGRGEAGKRAPGGEAGVGTGRGAASRGGGARRGWWGVGGHAC